jgi:hypothetical protein
VSRDDAFHQRQAETDTVAAGALQSHERLEDMLPIGSRDARSVVIDVDGHRTIGKTGPDCDPGGCVSTGIAQQVPEYALQAPSVGPHFDGFDRGCVR